ncbi:hypothetical protein BN3661_00740 [Eubacteriaceae bacterium CHKCI005]|nr:hypothetical protein BN3661_00740 [Eubacteriaceae bacterium CHKCI005]
MAIAGAIVAFRFYTAIAVIKLFGFNPIEGITFAIADQTIDSGLDSCSSVVTLLFRGLRIIIDSLSGFDSGSQDSKGIFRIEFRTNGSCFLQSSIQFYTAIAGESGDSVVDSFRSIITLIFGSVVLTQDSFTVGQSIDQCLPGIFGVVVVLVAFRFFYSLGQALNAVVNQAGKSFLKVGDSNVVLAAGGVRVSLDSFTGFHSLGQCCVGFLSEIFGVLGCGFVQSVLQILDVLIGGRTVGIFRFDKLDVIQVQGIIRRRSQSYIDVGKACRDNGI